MGVEWWDKTFSKKSAENQKKQQDTAYAIKEAEIKKRDAETNEQLDKNKKKLEKIVEILKRDSTAS